MPGEAVVEEVHEEQDLDDPTDPTLKVHVVLHLDLLVDPVQHIKRPGTLRGTSRRR